jgi:formylglycine-generating enzyme required for sulfatase activity
MKHLPTNQTKPVHSKSVSPLGRALGLGMIVTMFAATPCGHAASLSIRLAQGAELAVSGDVGSTNRVEFTTALSPTAVWQTLTNFTLRTSPTWINDVSVKQNSQRFYRVVTASAPFTAPAWLVYLSPGSLFMGSPESDPDLTDFETPVSKVTLQNGFWMDKYEVTQARFQAVTGRNPSSDPSDPDLPVDSVTWQEAVEFCALLTGQERAAGRIPAGYTYRLPTEAEWEYADRAGSTTRFSYGDDLTYSALDRYAWTGENSAYGTNPVGQKQANKWGLFDMLGNVAEWCQDWFGWYTPEAKTDPKGPAAGNDRVYRGGSWASDEVESRSAARGGLSSNSRLPSVGFRTVLAK